MRQLRTCTTIVTLALSWDDSASSKSRGNNGDGGGLLLGRNDDASGAGFEGWSGDAAGGTPGTGRLGDHVNVRSYDAILLSTRVLCSSSASTSHVLQASSVGNAS